MTMKSIPIATVFVGITASQFIFGIYVIALAAREKGAVLLYDRIDHSYSEHLPATSGLCLCRPTTLIDTP